MSISIKNRYITLLTLFLILFISGCSSSRLAGKLADGTIGYNLTVKSFQNRFNSNSERQIGDLELVKDNRTSSSYLYRFDNALAMSFVVMDDSEKLLSVILIGLEGEQYLEYVNAMIEAADKDLSPSEREKIVTDLLAVDPQEKTEIVRNQVAYSYEELGSYRKFVISEEELK